MAASLFLACERGDLELVAKCVEIGGADVNATAGHDEILQLATHPIDNLLGASPLFIASLHRKSKVVRYLVEHGANVKAGLPSSVWDDGPTVLHAAYYSVEPHLESSEQLDIIRCLVEAGADPSALSSEGIPIWMVDWFRFYAFDGHPSCLVSRGSCNPQAVALLIQLGMSVTQRCPVGRTVLHHLAGLALVDDSEVVNLLLIKGADLNARDNEGISPIMAAAIGNSKLPNISILKFLLDRSDIPNMDKIDALEVAAAVLLSYLKSLPPGEVDEYAKRYEDMINLLYQAMNLRQKENCPLPREEEKNGRAVEKFTSLDDLRQVQQRSSEYEMESIIIRLRIFKSLSCGAVQRYLWPYISDYCHFILFTERLSFGQTLDVCWKVLETILSFDKTDEGIYLASVSVAERLLQMLQSLHGSNDPLFNIETLETSLDLLGATYQATPPDEELYSSCTYLDDFYYFVLMLDVLPVALKTPKVTAFVSSIVSQNGRCADGRSFLHIAIRESGDRIFERVDFLVRNGANADAVDWNGNGALHFMARLKKNSAQHQAVARLLLENGAHLDRGNREGKTAADIWPEEMESPWQERDEFGVRIYELNVACPEWLKNEGVPPLKCLAAKVACRSNLHYVPNEGELPQLPVALIDFVEGHRR